MSKALYHQYQLLSTCQSQSSSIVFEITIKLLSGEACRILFMKFFGYQ